MSTPELTELLEGRYGLRLDPLTRGRLARALQDEADRLGSDPDREARRIAADPARQQRLIDAVTLQETSWFREELVWQDLAEGVLPAVIRAAGGRQLRVWSAGCANGQEAWSVAMLLAELGAPRFEVLASDLSAGAVARAEAGRYGERELRGLDAARRDRWLARSGDAWEVGAPLRDRVRFVHQNAATDGCPVAAGSCALVLCRYVLIYLTPAASDALLRCAAHALADEGRLVLGAAESLRHSTELFTLVPLPHSVVHRRRREDDARVARAALRRLREQLPSTSASAPRRTAPTTVHGDTGERVDRTSAATGPAALVEQGEAAAAAGDLRAAAAAFRGAAFLDPDDAGAHCRLGLALEALGDPGAERAFRAAWSALGRRPDAQSGDVATASLAHLLATKLEVPT